MPACHVASPAEFPPVPGACARELPTHRQVQHPHTRARHFAWAVSSGTVAARARARDLTLRRNTAAAADDAMRSKNARGREPAAVVPGLSVFLTLGVAQSAQRGDSHLTTLRIRQRGRLRSSVHIWWFGRNGQRARSVGGAGRVGCGGVARSTSRPPRSQWSAPRVSLSRRHHPIRPRRHRRAPSRPQQARRRRRLLLPPRPPSRRRSRPRRRASPQVIRSSRARGAHR